MALPQGGDKRQSQQTYESKETTQPKRPSSNGDEQPTLMSKPYNPNSAAYLAYPVKHVVSSLYRRMTEPPEQPVHRLLDAPSVSSILNPAVYTPKRSQSPFQPPPLTPLDLHHNLSGSATDALLLTRSLAEEIRLLIPPRLQLLDHWKLAYSLELHGSSLATLYEHCARVSLSNQRAGYILVIKDGSTAAANGSVFGAYLTDAPHPSQHYFGTGECFLWHLLELAGLPAPPSADTTNQSRTTTIRGERRTPSFSQKSPPPSTLAPPDHSSKKGGASSRLTPPPEQQSASGASTPDRIRFRAFPYSGINDFMIYCETGYLSVGGGDGHYGLWLDDTLGNGISEQCPTFGNEPLSDEGKKFQVLGVEVWYVGA
ncbi:hypothetical protein DV736_g4927, partial [Chaetothyriales sp. CBS 134916]